MAQKIAHGLVWWFLTLSVTALRSAETAALRKYVQQSANWQKLCSSSTPFPVSVTEHHVMEVRANTHTRLPVYTWGMMCDWKIYTAPFSGVQQGKDGW